MALIRLNHRMVRYKMTKQLMRPVDLADKLGVSRQMANHIIHHAGLKYAQELATMFNCRVSDLLIPIRGEPRPMTRTVRGWRSIEKQERLKKKKGV